MKGAIASVEIYGFRESDPARRFTLTVGAPTRDPMGVRWECRVVLADVHKPTPVVGSDSVEVLLKALDLGRHWVADLRQQGFVLCRDRAGAIPFDAF